MSTLFPSVPPEYEKAVKTAFNILDYADNTEKKLREKLARKGHTPDAVDFAVEYAKKTGALDDLRYMRRLAERLATVKLYGRRRIVNELFVKGFKKSDIISLDLSEVDFGVLCAERMKKTASRYPDRDKMYASLLRYGFTPSDIAAAREIVSQGPTK